MTPEGQVVDGVQPHMFGLLGVPPPQVCGDAHEPQFTVCPQVFVTVPQLSPAGQVVGQVTHWPVASQLWFAAQVPQVTVPPQPSGCVPHV